MPTIHITKEAVEQIERPEKDRVDYFDDVLRGFGIRVFALKPGGKPLTKAQEKTAGKTYFTMRRVNGKLTRTKIDTADKITAEKARKAAEGLLADMGRGIDPNEEKRQARQQVEEAQKHGITLQKALDAYLDKGKLKPRTIETYKTLCRLYLTDWLDKPANEITRDMVKARHADIASGKRDRRKLAKEADTEKGRKGKAKLKAVEPPEPTRREASADNCMRTLRAVLNYQFEEDEGGAPYANPVNILSSRKRKAWFKVERRQTRLKNSDLPAWYKAVMSLDNSIMTDYLLFLLFTGLRRQEAATLKWKQVDFEEGCFTLTGGLTGVTKNKQFHTLPLSDYLHNLLTDRKEGLKTELTEAKAALVKIDTMSTIRQRQEAHNRVALAESRLASPYVFPGEGATGYIVEPKRAIDTVTATTGISFSCHDLRRTFASLAESLDLSRYTIKALLNHKQDADVTGGYIVLDITRLREAMQKITDALQERIKTQHGQVIQMKSRAA